MAAFIPTLSSFSLAGKMAVITGGARGLGLAMSKALVLSGADLAIVDLNSKFPPSHRSERPFALTFCVLAEPEAEKQAKAMTHIFQQKYPHQRKA